jgi:hypothetical protein
MSESEPRPPQAVRRRDRGPPRARLDVSAVQPLVELALSPA